MNSIKSWWNNIAIAKRLYVVVAIIAVLVAFELLSLHYSVNFFSAIRILMEVTAMSLALLFTKSILNNLTQLNQDLEKKVEQRTQETKSAIKMRDQFISIASHELKTPLSTLQFQLQLLNRSLKDPAYGNPNTFSDSSLTQARRLDSLINELMDLTRIKSGQLELHPVRCSLSEITSDYTLAMNMDAAKKGSTISTNINTNIYGIVDPNRMGQVITNLVSNAIKYGEGKPIQVSLNEKNGIAILKVEDHGSGISCDKLEKIFLCYERATQDSGIQGLGLGLYISKEIITAHQGKVCVHSELGKGCAFIVEIPLDRNLNGLRSKELQMAEYRA